MYAASRSLVRKGWNFKLIDLGYLFYVFYSPAAMQTTRQGVPTFDACLTTVKPVILQGPVKCSNPFADSLNSYAQPQTNLHVFYPAHPRINSSRRANDSGENTTLTSDIIIFKGCFLIERRGMNKRSSQWRFYAPNGYVIDWLLFLYVYTWSILIAEFLFWRHSEL